MKFCTNKSWFVLLIACACICVIFSLLVWSRPMISFFSQPSPHPRPARLDSDTQTAGLANRYPEEEMLVDWPTKQVVDIVVEQLLYEPGTFKIKRTKIPDILKGLQPPVVFSSGRYGVTVDPARELVYGRLKLIYEDGDESDVAYYFMGVNSLVFTLDGTLYQRGSRFSNAQELSREHREIYGVASERLDESSAFSACSGKIPNQRDQEPLLSLDHRDRPAGPRDGLRLRRGGCVDGHAPKIGTLGYLSRYRNIDRAPSAAPSRFGGGAARDASPGKRKGGKSGVSSFFRPFSGVLGGGVRGVVQAGRPLIRPRWDRRGGCLVATSGGSTRPRLRVGRP